MADVDATFEVSNIKIPSKTTGWNLDAWKYVPKGANAKASPPPVIVLAHGFSANKKMGLAQYAEAFANAGYACVVFDYRRFGDSDGTPRECVRTSEQLDDYRTAIAWVHQQDEFDSQRVIVWGSSYSGGHAITLASEENPKFISAISQCPYVGGALKLSFMELLKLGIYGSVDYLRQFFGLEPLYIPASGPPGSVGVMTTHDSLSGMVLLVRDKRDYPNRVCASSVFEFSFYKPYLKASQIAVPLLLVVSEKDSLCPLDVALGVAGASDKVTLTKTPGGHFEMYPGGQDHEASLKAQLEFLRKQVPVA